MMIGYGLASFVWILNTTFGNDGGFIHFCFLWISKITAVAAAAEVVFSITAS
jgi:hypothetical protein